MAAKRHIEEEEQFQKTDRIISFNALSASIQLKLAAFPEIVVKQDEQQVLLYKLHNVCSETYRPTVCFTLRIFHDLAVSLWINDTQLQQRKLGC